MKNVFPIKRSLTRSLVLKLVCFALFITASGMAHDASAATVCKAIRIEDASGNSLTGVPITDGYKVRFSNPKGVTGISATTSFDTWSNGTYRVRAAFPGIVLSPAEVSLDIQPGDTIVDQYSCTPGTELRMRLVSTTGFATVSGTVRDRAGALRANSTFDIVSAVDASQRRVVATNSAGAFSVVLPPGTFSVQDSGSNAVGGVFDGDTTFLVTNQNISNLNFVITTYDSSYLPSAGSTITGTVVNQAGAALSRAISISLGDGRWFKTGPRGAFTITNVRPGTFTFVSRAGNVLAPNQTVTVASVPSTTTGVQLVLQSSATPNPPRVVVKDASGAPVAGRGVLIKRSSGDYFPVYKATNSLGEADFSDSSFEYDIKDDYFVSVLPSTQDFAPGVTSSAYSTGASYFVSSTNLYADGPNLQVTVFPHLYPNRITGILSLPSGAPAPAAFVNESVQANMDGSYAIVGVLPSSTLTPLNLVPTYHGCYDTAVNAPPVPTVTASLQRTPVTLNLPITVCPYNIDVSDGFRIDGPLVSFFSHGNLIGTKGTTSTSNNRLVLSNFNYSMLPITATLPPSVGTVTSPINQSGNTARFDLTYTAPNLTTQINIFVYISVGTGIPVPLANVPVSDPRLGTVLTGADGYARFTNGVLGETYNFVATKTNFIFHSIIYSTLHRPENSNFIYGNCSNSSSLTSLFSCESNSNLPGPVTGLTIHQNGRALTLSWDTQINATGYDVYRRSNSISEGQPGWRTLIGSTTGTDMVDIRDETTAQWVTYLVYAKNSIYTYPQYTQAQIFFDPNAATPPPITPTPTATSTATPTRAPTVTPTATPTQTSTPVATPMTLSTPRPTITAAPTANAQCSTDSDGDGLPDCVDQCPTDSLKRAPGACGCGIADLDSNKNRIPDCLELKSSICKIDSDNDGIPDCQDGCPLTPALDKSGLCGCEGNEFDLNRNGIVDCHDQSSAILRAKTPTIRKVGSRLRVRLPSLVMKGQLGLVRIDSFTKTKGKRVRSEAHASSTKSSLRIKAPRRGTRIAVTYFVTFQGVPVASFSKNAYYPKVKRLKK